MKNIKDNYDTMNIDIMSAVKVTQFKNPFICFDIGKYPVPTGDPFKNDIWEYLKNHIQASALRCGYTLYTNGGARPYIKLPHREFRCYKGKKYKNQSKLTLNSYRKTNMINNKSRRRRRGHLRPLHKTCRFTFTVCVDNIGYQIKTGRGCCTHRYHSKDRNKILNNTSKHLPVHIIQCLNYMHNGYTTNANIRNVIYRSTGRILSLSNIHYICKKLTENTNGDDRELLESLSSVDQMIDYFDRKNYDYYCLLHSEKNDLEQFISGVRTETNTNHELPSFIGFCKDSEKEQILKYCVEHREQFEITSSQHLMIAMVWILPQEKRLFHLFPEVIFIDITFSSNKEKRPLFTITGKTSTGKMLTLLMTAFLPNEKTWIFHWLFNLVFPNSF